jgi:hypothetical protein
MTRLEKRGAMTRNRRLAVLGVLALAISAAPAVAQPSSAGRIDKCIGAAFVVRGGVQMAVKSGDAVFETDVLRTGTDGHVGLMLKDDTRLSLGPGSEVRLQKFAYAPSQGQMALGLKVVRGLVAYVSGRIAKLAPDAVRLETPAAIVGVRGTTLLIQAEE